MQDQVWILYDWYYGKAPRYRDYVSPSMGRFVEGHWYDRGRKNKAGEQRKVYAFMNTTEKEDWVVVRLEQLLVPKFPGPHDVEGAALDVVLYALESVWGKAENGLKLQVVVRKKATSVFEGPER